MGPIWEFGPTGTQFATPVTLTLAYTNAELGGMPAASFAVSTVVGNAWQPLAATVVDTSAQVMSGQTTHLSPYALSVFSNPNCPSGKTGRRRAAYDCAACMPNTGGTACIYMPPSNAVNAPGSCNCTASTPGCTIDGFNAGNPCCEYCTGP